MTSYDNQSEGIRGQSVMSEDNHDDIIYHHMWHGTIVATTTPLDSTPHFILLSCTFPQPAPHSPHAEQRSRATRCPSASRRQRASRAAALLPLWLGGAPPPLPLARPFAEARAQRLDIFRLARKPVIRNDRCLADGRLVGGSHSAAVPRARDDLAEHLLDELLRSGHPLFPVDRARVELARRGALGVRESERGLACGGARRCPRASHG